MSKIFKPRRGLASTMSGTKASTVLASGELFIECPDAGVGKGYSNIKIGDGTTAYSSLPYALEGDTSAFKVTVTADTSADYDTAMGNIITGKSVGGLVGSIKQAISKLKADVTSLSDTLSPKVSALETAVETLNSKVPFGFGTDSSGNYGYKKTGADTVYPFKSYYGNLTGTQIWSNIGIGSNFSIGASVGYYYVICHVANSSYEDRYFSFSGASQIIRVRARAESPVMCSIYLVKATATTITGTLNISGGFVGIYRINIT